MTKFRIGLIGVAIIIVIVLLGFGRNGNEKSDKLVVTLGYLPITHALPIFEEEKLLEKTQSNVEIKLEKFSTWSDLTDALNAGRIDGASVLIELAMNAKSQGVDLKVVALGHRDGNVVIVSNDVHKVTDLKGKTFAIPHTQSTHNILLQEMLKKNGLGADDVNIVQLSPSEMPSSLASGAIAGYCVAEPFGTQAVSQKIGHVLYDSKDLWKQSLCCGLVLNDRFIQEHTSVVNEIIKQYHVAGERLDEAEAVTTAKDYLGQTQELLRESLKWINYSDLYIKPVEYESLCQKMREYKILDNPPTYEEFVYERD